MTFYRDRSGELCEAARFCGGNIVGDDGLVFDCKDYPEWLLYAMRTGTLETSVFGSGLIIHFRGGSYGLAHGDWVIRKRGGEITHCRGDRFASEYEAVA